MWPQQEVLLLLKNRSPSLSLHDEGQEQVLARQIPSRILFDSVSSTGPDSGQFQEQKQTDQHHSQPKRKSNVLSMGYQHSSKNDQ
jgi:hypothetical protein